ncbi:MAG: hypothetical protein AAGH19_07725 [Pseudomonadota bacterium]
MKVWFCLSVTLLASLASTLSFARSSVSSSDAAPMRFEQAASYWEIDDITQRSPRRGDERTASGGCAVLAFVIAADGTTHSHRVLYAWPDLLLNDFVVRNYEQATFKPTAENTARVPVYTAITVWTARGGVPTRRPLTGYVDDRCQKATKQYWEERLAGHQTTDRN